MSAPDLAELRRLLAEVRRPPPWKRDLGWVCQDGAAQEGFSHGVACANHTSGAALIVAAVNALPYLLAKVEAAERLAEAAGNAFLDWDGAEKLHAAADAYRKAGAP